MLPANVNATKPDPKNVPCGEDLFEDYLAHMAATGRGNVTSERAARLFLEAWPDPSGWEAEPLQVRLSIDPSATALLAMLMMSGRIRPGWDWLVRRKLSAFWSASENTTVGDDMALFTTTAIEVGFTPTQARRAGSQSVGRVLIQTGRRLDQLTVADFDALADACAEREADTGQGWRHYRSAIVCAHHVLFHLGVVDTQPVPAQTPLPLPDRFAGCTPELGGLMVAYLERKAGTCRPKTVSSLATRLNHFGLFLTAADPALTSFNQLDRRRHIEPYLNSVANASSSKTGRPLTIADQGRRIRAVDHMLVEITEWGWDDAPQRKLIFRSDHPRLPKPLPRYLPVDADRKLAAALEQSPYRLAADALLLARAVGLRIGELVDLELDCVHDIAGNGSWLKVPLGKLDTERMVPLDDETVGLIDRIAETRTPGRPINHPRDGRPTQFLFTHHGRRLSQTAIRHELARSAEAAGIGPVTPHQLRHTYATAMVNAGVSLQALMALLGHVSAQMSLRYGHLFDSTVRAEYERALTLAKASIGAMPVAPIGRNLIPVNATNTSEAWQDAPAIKARLAGGYCLRAPAQGACTYANICEHCPNLRTDAASVTILAAQRVDTEALAADAQRRGWIDEADRHHQLLARLDHLIEQATA